MSSPIPSFHTIYVDTHDLTGPSLASGETLNNFPEKRKRLNYRSITTAPHFSERIALKPVNRPLALDATNTRGVHEEGMLKLWREGWEAWVALKAERKGFTKDHGLKSVPVSVGVDGGDDEIAEPECDYYMIPGQIAPKGVVTRPGNTVLGWITQYSQVCAGNRASPCACMLVAA